MRFSYFRLRRISFYFFSDEKFILILLIFELAPDQFQIRIWNWSGGPNLNDLVRNVSTFIFFAILLSIDRKSRVVTYEYGIATFGDHTASGSVRRFT